MGNISVGSDGEVKIGDKIFVRGDEVKCGNIDIDKNGVRLKSKEGDIFVSEDGSVKVGDILVDGDEVNCGNIKVTDDGIIIKTNDGDIQIKGKNINIGKK